MKFKEFVKWCDDRAYDGCWGLMEAIICIDIIEKVQKNRFWKREKVWKEFYEEAVLDEIVNPTNEKIQQFNSCK